MDHRMTEMGMSESAQRTPRPSLLDIAKIDGSWAQVVGAGNRVNYLQTRKSVQINWDDYTLVQRWGQVVKLLQERYGQNFTRQEIANIHWGPEQAGNPELKRLVTVFGEYMKKQHKR
jgi:hypothetical protein